MIVMLTVAVALQASGPALLVMRQNDGIVFVPFSTFARCESARRTFVQEAEERARNYARQGYKVVVPPTPPKCIPG